MHYRATAIWKVMQKLLIETLMNSYLRGTFVGQTLVKRDL